MDEKTRKKINWPDIFNPVVLITQPRKLAEAIASMEQYIKIPKVWFRGYTEPEVTEEMNKYVRRTDYTHYIICADDVVVGEHTIEEISKCAKTFALNEKTSSNITTGWCNLYTCADTGGLSSESNICEKKITLTNGLYPLKEDYSFSPMRKILTKEGLFRTYLASFALSCIPRKILIKYPLCTYDNGYASDHKLSRALNADGIEIWSSAKMFIRHLKEKRKSALKKNWLTGNISPCTIEEI